MYHNMARSAGLSYWQSVAYTFAGSALWEIAGETTPPSKNDQIASGIAGSFLGEPLFLTSRLLLGRRDDGPGFWRALVCGHRVAAGRRQSAHVRRPLRCHGA